MKACTFANASPTAAAIAAGLAAQFPSHCAVRVAGTSTSMLASFVVSVVMAITVFTWPNA
jgi:hypothetical protein